MIFNSIMLQKTGFYCYGWIAFHGVYIPNFLYSVISWWASGLILLLGTVLWSAVSMRVQRILSFANFISFGWIPRSVMAGSYGRSLFRFVRNIGTVFPVICNDGTGLYSHQQWIMVQFSPILFSRLLLDVWGYHSNYSVVKSYCNFNFPDD